MGLEPVIKDIGESPGGLLPVRAGGHVGDADKSPKEIHWVEVPAYIAAPDRALHQGLNRFRDLSVGSCEHFLGSSDPSVQRCCDDLLRLDGKSDQRLLNSNRIFLRAVLNFDERQSNTRSISVKGKSDRMIRLT
jgi:hypothetical protein